MRSSGKPLGSRTAVSRSRGFAHSLGDDGDLCFREIPAEAPAFELARVGLQRQYNVSPARARILMSSSRSRSCAGSSPKGTSAAG